MDGLLKLNYKSDSLRIIRLKITQVTKNIIELDDRQRSYHHFALSFVTLNTTKHYNANKDANRQSYWIYY